MIARLRAAIAMLVFAGVVRLVINELDKDGVDAMVAMTKAIDRVGK